MDNENRELLIGIRAAVDVSRLNLLEFIAKHEATSGLAVALQAVETARLEIDYFLATKNFGPSEVQ